MDAPPLILTYFPLWGAEFDSDEAGLIGGRMMAYYPEPSEWRQVQKSSVWKERWSHQPYDLEGPPPPLCLVLGERLAPDASHLDVINQRAASWMQEGYAATLALRLLKPGWFLDPQLAECTIAFEGFNQRLVGPYRQAFMGGVPQDLPQPYTLSIAECATRPAHAAATTRLWELVWRYYEAGRNSSADIAITNFMRSYGFQMGDTQKMLTLFTALEAMFGGMGTREIGQVRMQRPFATRIATAVEIARSPDADLDPDAVAAWLSEEGRALRNTLAHGRVQPAAVQNSTAVAHLQQMARVALRQYLAFAVTWEEQKQEFVLRYQLPFDAPLAAAYNAVLDQHTRGVWDAAGILT